MSADALRQVFAEFGFKVDDGPLGQMLAKTQRAIDLQKELTEAEKAVVAELKRSHEESAKASEKARADAEKEAEATRKRNTKEIDDNAKAAAAAAELVKGKLLGVVGAIAAVVVGAQRFVTAFAADVMALREASDAARVTEQQFQELTLASTAAGVSGSTMASGLNTLAEGLRAIEARTGGPTNALWRLGVRARNVDGTMRGTNDVLLDLADRFERVRSPVHRARLAQELFGASGRRMLQVLAGGSAALRRQREDFAALGGGVLPEAVEEGRRFTMAQARMRVALDSTRSVVATALLPIFTRATNEFANFTGWLSRMTRGTHILNGVFIGLGVVGAAAGGAVTAAWLPVIAPIAAVVLGATALALAFDDIQNLAEGNNSLIGYLIDQYAGFGTAARWVQQLRDAWNGVVDALRRVSEMVDRLPAWARTGVDVATFGLRGFLPAGQSTGAEGGAQVPAATPTPTPTRRTRGGRSATPAAPAQPMIPQANLAAWAAALPQGALPVTAPAATVPAVRGGARTVIDRRQTTNTFTLNGITNPQEAANRVAQILDERARRERDRDHPRDPED